MTTRQYLGFSLVLLAGCAAQTTTKPPVSSSSARPNRPADQPSTQPVEEPKWEVASPTASDLLAQKAAEYAKTLQTPDPNAPPGATEDPANARFSAAGGVKKRHHAEEAPSVASNQPATGALGSNHAAQGASARVPPQATGFSDEPQIVPESADFESPGIKTARGESLAATLQKRVAQDPGDIASQLDLQLYGMLTDDTGAELAAVSALPDADRELVSALVDGLSNFRATVRQGGNLLAAEKIKPLLEMADRLRSQADLTVPIVSLCSRVDGYGKYTPIVPGRFPAGRENPVIVYCEVENFLARQVSDQWQTRMTEQVTLYTDMGMLAWSDSKREVTDECRNHRHDFFTYNVIHLPEHLSIGRYLLKVSIVDKNADHVAEATVPLEIVAE